MRLWIKAGIIFFTLIIELIMANILAFDVVKPDLMLIVIICLSFLSNSEGGIIIGFTGGLAKDIFSVNLLGTHALVKTIIGYISGIIRERIFYQHLLWIITIVTFLFTFLNNILIYYLLESLHNDYNFIAIFMKHIVLQAIVNSILAPIIFISIRKICTYLQRRS